MILRSPRRIAVMLLRIVLIVGVVSLATSLLIDLVPGDPATAILGDNASPERYAEVRADLRLDRPVLERYGEWVKGAVRGDFGRSIIPPTENVADAIKARLPVTLELTALAMVMSLGGAVIAVLVSARRPGGPADSIISGVALAGVSVPSFLVALGLIFALVFNPDGARSLLVVLGIGIILSTSGYALWRARQNRSTLPSLTPANRRLLLGGTVFGAIVIALGLFLPDFPRQGFSRLTSGDGIDENLRTIFLPALTLAILEGAVFTRVLRSDVLETMEEDFILASKAKGMRLSTILRRDALRPSSLSLVTVSGVAFGRLLGGTVIVETIFNLPGMGSMLVEGVQAKDFPIVQASVVVLATLFVITNTLVDLSYSALDPRIRRA